MERISSGWSDSTGEDIDGNDLEIRIRSKTVIFVSGRSSMKFGLVVTAFLIKIQSPCPRTEKERS